MLVGKTKTTKARSQSDIEAALIKGAHDRSEMIRRFGFVPTSVLRHCRANKLKAHIQLYQRAGKHFDIYAPITSQGRYQANVERASRAMGVSMVTRTPSIRSFSIMPPSLVDFFVRYYAAPGQTYLDPFCGQGVQMQVAALRGMDYWGYDLNPDFIRFCQSVRDGMVGDHGNGSPSIHIHEGDSRFPDAVPDGVGDFCFTSPPYWNVEDYGDQPGQLSAGSYSECLQGLQEIARAWLPKFRRAAYCVVNVGDIRHEAKLLPFHSDVLQAWVAAGWEFHDIWILADMLIFGRTMAVPMNKLRRVSRDHEYAMVFRPR